MSADDWCLVVVFIMLGAFMWMHIEEDLKEEKMKKICDNFKLFYNIMTFNSDDEFYFVQILVRPKDGNKSASGNNKNRLVKYYTIRSIEELQKYEKEIKGICELCNARAYIHPTKRSFASVAKEMILCTTAMYCAENFKGMKSIFSTACGRSFISKDKKYVVDIDGDELDVKDIKVHIENYCEPLNKNKVLYEVPTLNGIHLICAPFNVAKFREKYPSIDLHTNNPTLLYYKKVI